MCSSKTYAVVSHDAGGAEILSSYVKREKPNVVFALAGPAERIFKRKLGQIENKPLIDAINAADVLLCGTSLPSAHERNAIRIAKEMKLHSIAFLDHWINYPDRFKEGAKLLLPDEIWTVDERAFALSKEYFPNTNLRQIANPFELDCMDEMKTLERSFDPPMISSKEHHALYVTEPTSEHALRNLNDERFWGYTEQEALKYFLMNLNKCTPAIRSVTIRPHPSERTGKYDGVRAPDGITLSVSKNTSLLVDISSAAWVVGCNSMAMVVGSWLGRKVVCSIPPGGRGFDLSIPDIIFIKHLS